MDTSVKISKNNRRSIKNLVLYDFAVLYSKIVFKLILWPTGFIILKESKVFTLFKIDLFVLKKPILLRCDTLL